MRRHKELDGEAESVRVEMEIVSCNANEPGQLFHRGHCALDRREEDACLARRAHVDAKRPKHHRTASCRAVALIFAEESLWPLWQALGRRARLGDAAHAIGRHVVQGHVYDRRCGCAKDHFSRMGEDCPE